jgi:TRAP-type uncharacterized transport system substrate-binding protein
VSSVSGSALKERKNTWTVGVAGGLLSGTYMKFADELAKVLDDGDNLRILPIVSYGAASNLDDLLYLKGVDVAVTQSDVFEYFRTVRKTSNLENRINYVIRLSISEVHILAGKKIKSLEDLRGKKVNFGPAGSGSSLTGTIIFRRLGIEVEQVLNNNPQAIQQLKSGELAALVRMIGKPIDFFAKILADSGLHFVPIPFSKKFGDYYTLGEFTHQEYPSLVAEGERVDTIAVPTVLAVYNWAKGGDRYRRVERFIESLFAKFDKLQSPPFHPKWRDVNLAATVPGWNRFSVAEAQLQKLHNNKPAPSQEDMQSEFRDFLSRSADGRGAPRSESERDALFREFLSWREKQGNRGH